MRRGSRRVLINARLYGAGGSETHLLHLTRLLAERGAEVTLVARYAHPETPLVRQHQQIPLRLVTTPFARNLSLFRASTAWAMAGWPTQLRRASFDLLYTLELTRFATFLGGFVRPGGYVIGNRFGEPLPAQESLPTEVLRSLNGILVESEMQAQAMQQGGADGLPTRIIPHLGYTRETPRREPRQVGELRVAFLGRFSCAKGVYRLLDIWPELGIGLARLDFYGSGTEGARLQAEVRRRGLAAQGRVHGGWSTAEELRAIMQATDLVVLPSETEGLPQILLEAMAHGVPFVASDVGAVRTLAEDNPDVRVVGLETGSFIEAIRQMAQAIRDSSVGGERLQRYFQRRFGFERLAERWVQALLEPEQFWAAQDCSMVGAV